MRGQITYVAASCFWHSLLGVGQNGKSTTKVLTWADKRSRDQVPVLRKKLNETETHNRTGARFHSSFWPAKILWLKSSQQGAFARTFKWLSLSDYIQSQLCGDDSTSISMASATGIFDIRKCEWDTPLLEFLRLKETAFPDIASGRQSFRLNKKYAKRWPQLAHAEWLPAIGDGAANNIGSGCVTKNRAALMLGTSGAMRVMYEGAPPEKLPPGLWCYRVDRGRVIVGGALSDGGGLYAWLRENLGLPKNAEAIIARGVAAGHGLIFLPFLAGERGTGYHEHARAAILGLTASTNSVDIAQAAMESVAYRFAEILDQLSAIAKIDQIVASGGALRSSKVWTQIIANVLGREIKQVDIPEASLRGAALLAFETIGNIENIERSSPTGKAIFPDMEKHKVYKTARKSHTYFYDLITQNR